MKSTKFPITIAGQAYHVDRTTDGSPAVYVVTDGGDDGDAEIEHIDEPGGLGIGRRARGLVAHLEEGDVIIFAKRAKVTP